MAVLDSRENLLKPVARLILVKSFAISDVIQQRPGAAVLHHQIEFFRLAVNLLKQLDNTRVVKMTKCISLLLDSPLVLLICQPGLVKHFDGCSPPSSLVRG